MRASLKENTWEVESLSWAPKTREGWLALFWLLRQWPRSRYQLSWLGYRGLLVTCGDLYSFIKWDVDRIKNPSKISMVPLHLLLAVQYIHERKTARHENDLACPVGLKTSTPRKIPRFATIQRQGRNENACPILHRFRHCRFLGWSPTVGGFPAYQAG